MAHSISQAFTKNKSDELYTPKILIDAIYEEIDNWYCNSDHTKILLPFDTEESEFAYFCREHKYRYECSHINTGTNFFDLEKPRGKFSWLILSNPPFSKKKAVFERLYEWNWPFAMVMNCMALNYHEIIECFSKIEPEFIFFDKRVSYDGNPSSFGSMYVTRYLIQENHYNHLEHNNTGKNFIPSRMYESVQKIK